MGIDWREKQMDERVGIVWFGLFIIIAITMAVLFNKDK